MEILEITKEMYEALKKPLPTEAVKPHPSKTFLSTIKAIFVTERLNDVFGCGAWQIRAEKIEEGKNSMIVIKTTLTIPKYGVYYESFGGNDNGGENSKNFDLGDAYKGATTDGITKIGSYLGIGIEVFKGHGNTAPKAETTKIIEKTSAKPQATPESEAIGKKLLNISIELEKCDTEEKCKAIWEKYTDLQSNTTFRSLVSNAKVKALKNPLILDHGMTIENLK